MQHTSGECEAIKGWSLPFESGHPDDSNSITIQIKTHETFQIIGSGQIMMSVYIVID